MPSLRFSLAFLAFAAHAVAAEYHVAPTGADTNSGEPTAPLKTIGAAAAKAVPGDTVTVHAGTYRERVDPPRGGLSDTQRIVYRAAPGEEVVITGSERVTGWTRVAGDTWKVVIPDAFFGDYNPYTQNIKGDWLQYGEWSHTGAVYLDGDWLLEARDKAAVLAPVGKTALWHCEHGKDGTVITAQFAGVDPNSARVEIGVRESAFTPRKTGVNYITVRGFTLCNTATRWAPPTAGQIGAVGPHWSKGWIIEGNRVHHSKTIGISLGKYGDEFDNRETSAKAYVATIERALKNGWNKDTVGSHIVRDNIVSHCEQDGIVGSLGAAFSVISGNTVHTIHTQKVFRGYEIAAIKFHGAIDVIIRDNHIHHACGGIWLDWMTQGVRVTGNLMHDNPEQDLSLEVNHGPILVDNNLFLSGGLMQIANSQGCAFVHNTFTAKIYPTAVNDTRQTPYQKPHSTELAGFHDNPRGDTRFLNNLFAGDIDMTPFDKATLSPVTVEGNVYRAAAKITKHEKSPLLAPAAPDAAPRLVEKADGWYLALPTDPAWRAAQKRALATTATLGATVITKQEFTAPDGAALTLDTDYLGIRRDPTAPFPGALETAGSAEVKVWPKP